MALAAFCGSRALAWGLGVRFDAAPLDYFWQVLDPTLLRGDLIGSLLHLHSQPPGFNLLLGLVLKTGAPPAIAFALLYHAVGLASCIGLFLLLERLGMDGLRAGVVAALFTASPTAVVYEHWLFYTHLAEALLIGGALAAHALVVRQRPRDALALSLAVAALACTRSLFHLVWALAIVAGTLVLARRARPGLRMGPLVGAAAPALLLVLALYAKNAVLFGSPASSTWLGMSLAKLTTWRLEPALRERWVEEGILSPAARVRPFSPLSSYPRELVAGPARGHPALDRIVKPGNYTNFNHGAYLRLNRLYLQDALTVLRRSPQTWLRSMGLAWMRYAIPPTQYGFVASNANAYAAVDRVYQLATGVPEAWTGARRREALGDPGYLVHRIRWLYWAATFAAAGFALWRLRRGADAGERAILLYCLANAAWIAGVANALELGENQRFQVMAEPLHVVLIAWAGEWAWRHGWPRRRPRSG